MASTYVNDLRLNEMATGDASGSWGTVTNTNLELIGEAFSYGTETIGDADSTLTIADGAADAARSFYLKITSSVDLTTTRIVTLGPNTVSKVWMIENATTGSQVITIKQGSGATINVPNGQVKMISTDGAGSGGAVLDLLVDVDLTGTTTLVNLDVSGTALVTGVLTTTAATVFNGGFTANADSTLGTDKKVQFRDAAIYINSSVDGQLDIVADTEIQIAATTVDLNGALDVSGTALVTGVLTTTAATVSNGGGQFNGAINVGVDDTGYDVKFFGATAGAYMLWDESADDLILGGAAGLSVNSTALVTGVLTTTAATVSNGGGQFNGAINVGVDDTGYDVKFFGATAGAYMLWDESADDLILGGAAGLSVNSAALVTGVLTTTAATVFNGGFASNANSTVGGTLITTGNMSISETGADNEKSLTIANSSVSGALIGVEGSGGNRFVGSAVNNMFMGTTGADGLEFATNNTVRMVIESGGDVGIGTSSPGSKLDINRGSAGLIANFTDGVNTNFQIGTSSLLATIGPSAGSTAMAFKTGDTERMRIDASGNVLVGATTSAYARFETTRADTGNVGVGRFLASAASGYSGEALQVIAAQAGGTDFNLLSCYYANGAAYAFKVRGDGTIYAQNTTVQSASDARFKENIVNSTQGLDVVTALRPVRFDIKEGHGVSAKTNQLGFIAQEVKAVFPDAVDVWGESDDPENPYLSLGSTALIPVLTKAIQELKAIVDTQASTITTLTERITALEG
jgi:hypothetical protein